MHSYVPKVRNLNNETNYIRIIKASLDSLQGYGTKYIYKMKRS